MRRIPLLLFIFALHLSVTGQILAQGMGVSIGFHNDTKHGILVQAYTVVNNTPTHVGQPFLVTPSKTGYDSNVPQGHRVITIHDSSKPTKILLQTTITVQNRDLVFSVRPGPNGQLMLVAKKQ
jgi:hypothetical protein